MTASCSNVKRLDTPTGILGPTHALGNVAYRYVVVYTQYAMIPVNGSYLLYPWWDTGLFCFIISF